MWHSRTKDDLIIEVWEKLDCENVGAAEIEAIETVVADSYGRSAVASPMVIARRLADEGAELRHSEIMELYSKRASDRPYDAVFRNVSNIDDLRSAKNSIRRLENLRRKYSAEYDKNGLRLVRDEALLSKQTAKQLAEESDVDAVARQINAEIALWFTIWLQTPEVFETWIYLRQTSPEFIEKFGRVRGS